MRNRRAGIVIAVGVGLVPFLLSPAQTDKKTEVYSGKVVPFNSILDKENATIDKDAAPFWLALVTDDGKTYPLIKDGGSRLFFTDPMMLNRPVKLTARLVADGKLLQVFQIRTVKEGKLYEPFYWCDICVIKRFAKHDCECCGAPMEFREELVKE